MFEIQNQVPTYSVLVMIVRYVVNITMCWMSITFFLQANGLQCDPNKCNRLKGYIKLIFWQEKLFGLFIDGENSIHRSFIMKRPSMGLPWKRTPVLHWGKIFNGENSIHRFFIIGWHSMGLLWKKKNSCLLWGRPLLWRKYVWQLFYE